MGMIQRVAGLLGMERRDDRRHPSWDALAPGIGHHGAISARAAENLSSVLACTTAISSALAYVPALVYRRDGDNRLEVLGHPMRRITREGVNDDMTWPDFLEHIVASALLTGNGLAEIIRSNNGQLAGFRFIPWGLVTVAYLSSGRLAYDVGDGKGRARRLLQGEVLHLRDRTDDGLVGRSRLSRAAETVAGVNASNAFARSFLDRGLAPSGVIKLPGTLTADQREMLRGQMRDRHEGAANAGRTLILDGGMEWAASQISPEDAELLETRKFGIIEVCRLFQVPPPIVQAYENNTFTNAAQAGLWFGQFTLAPWARKIEAEFARSVFPTGGPFELELDLSGSCAGIHKPAGPRTRSRSRPACWTPTKFARSKAGTRARNQRRAGHREPPRHLHSIGNQRCSPCGEGRDPVGDAGASRWHESDPTGGRYRSANRPQRPRRSACRVWCGMTKSFTYVSSFPDRHGKRRYRFRRKGYRTHYFREPFGTKAFEREYAGCLEADPAPVGAGRIAPGSVADVIGRYYADNAFLDLRPATQTVYRGVLERFRTAFGTDPMRQFDADRIARLMTAMRDKPHAAARLRKLLAQLFIIARRAKLVPHSFDPVKDTKAPKAETNGYHRWSEDELDMFEARHALGTKSRLAFALLLYSAQRSGDVRFMSHEMIASDRIPLDQSKTNNAVDVPIVQPLREALDAGPLGMTLLLETKDGDAFTPKGFYGLLKKACRSAGLPHCSPHGLRKSAARRCREAGCSDEEGMAITGHKSVREYRRYAGEGARSERADAAMTKVMANRADKLARNKEQAVENRA